MIEETISSFFSVSASRRLCETLFYKQNTLKEKSAVAVEQLENVASFQLWFEENLTLTEGNQI